MEEILNKIGQLQYEISCLELDEETLTGVTLRTEELKELVKNCSIPAVVGQSEQLVCDCGKPYNETDLEHGMCHKCWEPTKEAN